jgi:hypothetical protein
MIARNLLFAVAFACVTAPVQAQDHGIVLAMTIDQNGKQLSSPKILVQSAAPAELRVGDQLQVKLVATNASNSADVQMKVYANEGSGLTLVGSPRILVTYGENSAISWSSASGAKYKITLAPRLASIPNKT